MIKHYIKNAMNVLKKEDLVLSKIIMDKEVTFAKFKTFVTNCNEKNSSFISPLLNQYDNFSEKDKKQCDVFFSDRASSVSKFSKSITQLAYDEENVLKKKFFDDHMVYYKDLIVKLLDASHTDIRNIVNFMIENNIELKVDIMFSEEEPNKALNPFDKSIVKHLIFQDKNGDAHIVSSFNRADFFVKYLRTRATDKDKFDYYASVLRKLGCIKNTPHGEVLSLDNTQLTYGPINSITSYLSNNKITIKKEMTSFLEKKEKILNNKANGVVTIKDIEECVSRKDVIRNISEACSENKINKDVFLKAADINISDKKIIAINDLISNLDEDE